MLLLHKVYGRKYVYIVKDGVKMSKVYDLYCPNCGAYITFQTNECIYCGNKVFTEAPKKDLALKYLKSDLLVYFICCF